MIYWCEAGKRKPEADLVMFFRNVIAVPGGYLDDYFSRFHDLHLASET
jgi:hypothetical protein